MASLAVAVFLCLVSLSAAVPRQLLQTANPTFTNGDFALPGATALNPGGYATLSPETPDVITGWVITSGDVDYVSTKQWQAPPGASYSVDVSGDQAGSIQQTFVTAPSFPYTATFQLAGSPGAGTPVKMLQVSAAGAMSTYTFDTTNTTTTEMGYLPQTFAFTATDPSTTLVFTSLSNEPEGPVIGDVVLSGAGVAPVPAPALAPASAPATSPNTVGGPAPSPAALTVIPGGEPGPAPAPAPGLTTPIIASFIVPQPLTIVNSSTAFAAMTAALNSEFATPNTTAVIRDVAPGPNPLNETAITFEMQPTTGAALPAAEEDNLRAAFTTLAENRDTLMLPAGYTPASGFSVVSFPGGASVIGSGAPYSSPTANSTIGLLNFQLPRGVQNVSANETLLLQQVAAHLNLKPSEVLTAALAAANGSTNATAVSTYLTMIGSFSDSPQRISELAGNISAALKNGTLGLDPAVFGTPSNIMLSPSLMTLLGSLPPGTTLPPSTALPPGTTIPPGIVLPTGTTNTSTAATGTTPSAPAGGATKVGYTLVGLASAMLVAALF